MMIIWLYNRNNNEAIHVYVGGNAGKSNIEVHDVQFVAAEQPTDAYRH